ncbi:MAG: hypothetical protein A3G21_00890 [Acidobacteria bacterium RIFCSPLOWO2_12_FULL_66_21]|nr:MAG: hypothetical protein A3G21_00890 [Acidobacteria bacterium RIFCSPLOWO2_12_FULL_66_21]
MIRTRYDEAAKRAAGKRVLEVVCWPDMRRSSWVATSHSTSFAALGHTIRDCSNVLQMNARGMPFANSSFDLVVLFEALYNLPDAELFMSDCRRVLSPGGTVLLSSVNPEWRGGSPSPMSTRYFSVLELELLLRRHSFEPEPSSRRSSRGCYSSVALDTCSG